MRNCTACAERMCLHKISTGKLSTGCTKVIHRRLLKTLAIWRPLCYDARVEKVIHSLKRPLEPPTRACINCGGGPVGSVYRPFCGGPQAAHQMKRM